MEGLIVDISAFIFSLLVLDTVCISYILLIDSLFTLHSPYFNES